MAFLPGINDDVTANLALQTVADLPHSILARFCQQFLVITLSLLLVFSSLVLKGMFLDVAVATTKPSFRLFASEVLAKRQVPRTPSC